MLSQSSEKPVYIYALIDPRDGEIRYVGKTWLTLSNRLCCHFRDARNGIKRHVYNWIRQLFALELKPTIQIIEECTKINWIERETYWIAYGRQQGWRLTNLTDGGEGQLGHSVSNETRQKLSVAKRNISDETRHKMSVAQQGNQKSLGCKHTDKAKDKHSDATRGEKNPQAKLTESDVYGIRRMLHEGREGREIARVYGVSYKTISNIKHRKRWGWLPDEF